MRLDDLAAEIQANTPTASGVQVTPTMLFDPKELLEYPLAELCRDAGAGIRHSNVQESFAVCYRILPRRHADRHRATARGIFEGIGNEVGKDNTQARNIATHNSLPAIPNNPQDDFRILVPLPQCADGVLNQG